MEPFILNLLTRLTRTERHISNLEHFLASPRGMDVSVDERKLIEAQIEHNRALCKILSTRLSLHGVKI